MKGMTMKFLSLSIASLIVLFAATVSGLSAGQMKDKSAIGAVNQQFEKMFKSQNADGLAALYTLQGQVMPTNADFVTGRDNIRNFWSGAFKSGLTAAKLTSVELTIHGETAIEIGKYVLKNAEGKQADQGKYIVIWQKENGDWKLHRDIFNSSVVVK
jgi:uncharacterized protein (TIGR02246 family)